MTSIMLVDDNDAARELIGAQLQTLGFAVDAFADADAALQALGAAPARWALIVTDLLMPGIDGRAFAERAAPLAAPAPIVALTGTLPDDLAPGALGNGKLPGTPFAAVLIKPVRLAAWRDVVAALGGPHG